MNVADASFAVSVLAIFISAFGVISARRSAQAAIRSAVAADRSAAADERSLDIERRRRHEERRPDLDGSVDTPDGGHSYQLQVTLDPKSCPLTAMEIAIRSEQGVSFQHGVPGVAPVGGSAATPLRAFAYDGTSKPAGVEPGQTMSWNVDVANEYSDVIMVDATCHAEGKGEGEDRWIVTIRAPVTARLTNTVR